ncbi:MAG: diphthine--ammonia ligase [Actinomycetia bacterium]|nr:diphthine--ammonia ligase [Actinomycetes bacterium]
MDFAISYSGGKDSALALYRMIQKGHTPLAMITTIDPEQGRSWFHGIQDKLLWAVADSLGIPLISCNSTPETYNESFVNALKEARAMGARACVFGDIDIDDHRIWNEKRCVKANLACTLPLWQNDREAVLQELLSAGFKALIKIVDTDRLDESFLGQTLTNELIDRIRATGADACGENGEYHTLVYDGPLFSQPVPIKLGTIIDLGRYKAIDIS